MLLIDTSVWIDIFRDASGRRGRQLHRLVEGRDVYLTRFIQLELLAGTADEREWQTLDDYLDSQLMIEASSASWRAAARLYFDARRIGKTVRSSIDCCIAQLGIEYELLLLHRDRDFQHLAKVSDLNEHFVEWA